MRYYPKSSAGPAFLQARRQAGAESPQPNRSAVGVLEPAPPAAAPLRPAAYPLSRGPAISPGPPGATYESVLRRFCFPLALTFVFLRFSFLHEIILVSTGVNLYLPLVVGLPAALLAVFSRGLQRTFFSPPAKFWLLFTLWMVIDIPFSNWRSDSLNSVFQYTRVNLIMLVVIAGVVLSLKDCYRFMTAIALGAIVNIASAGQFIRPEERLTQLGSIANSNDYAAHVLLVLPFLLWVGWTARTAAVRWIAVSICIAGVLIGARAGSRGAMIAAGVTSLFLMLRSSGATRLVYAIVLPILAVIVVASLPQSIHDRYETLIAEDRTSTAWGALPSEAEMSRETRKYLLTTSLEYTLWNPLFGVGPNEFSSTEGTLARQEGRHGSWQETHNTYTQVSSEDGIPALIFFVAAILTTFRLLTSVYNRPETSPQVRKVRRAAFCLMLSMVGFGSAIFFLSLAYSMYLPSLTGLAIALKRAADAELPALAPATAPAA